MGAYILLSQPFRILDLVLPMLYMHVPDTVRLCLELLLPLQKERGWDNDEGRAMFVLLCRLIEDHGRDHLNGLAETHVVRKDAALVPGVVFLVDHPADTNDLVREEADFHAGEVVLQAERGCQVNSLNHVTAVGATRGSRGERDASLGVPYDGFRIKVCFPLPDGLLRCRGPFLTQRSDWRAGKGK